MVQEQAAIKEANNYTDEMNQIQIAANQTNNNIANIMSQFQQLTVNLQQETKEKKEREKREKAAVAAREEQYQKWLIQISGNVATINQNSVPRSIVNTNTSAISISNFTTKSNQLSVITSAKTRVPKRTMETQDSVVTDDTKVVPKYQKIYGDSSEATAATTGVESHSENHDLHNGDKSAPNHDHQTGFKQRNHEGPFRED